MKLKEFTHCIIVDENDRPMTYSFLDKQLCYCTNETWKDEHNFVEIYTIKEARKLINKTNKHRRLMGDGESLYRIMPVLIP